MSLTDAGEPLAAHRIARSAGALARRLRRPLQEARAHEAIRATIARIRTPAPDLDAIAPIESLGLPTLTRNVVLTESTLALRRGDLRTAAELLRRCPCIGPVGTWPPGSLLVASLLGVAERTMDPVRAREIAARSCESTAPGLCVQILALVARAAPALRTEMLERLRDLPLPRSGPARTRAREFLSIREAVTELTTGIASASLGGGFARRTS